MADKAFALMTDKTPDLAGYDDDLGQGMEEARPEHFSIPRLVILHKQSPQCDTDNGAFVPGAKQGSMFNTVTKAIYDEVILIPCFFRQTWIEWIPRTKGGGFVHQHMSHPRDANTQVGGPEMMPSGNELVDTYNFFCMMMREDNSGADPVMLGFTSVQRRKGKDWLTTINQKTATRPDGSIKSLPSYACSYKMSTVPESNDKGNWAGWKIDAHLWVPATSPLYTAAKAFYQACSKDVVIVEYDQEDVEQGEDRLG